MASEVFSKVVLSTKDYLAEAKMRNHFTLLDRPIEYGGGNNGPTPIEYFLSAIAGCVSMTLRFYLNRKQWDVGDITVEVNLKEKLTQNGIEKTIYEEISFEKEISQLQRKELLRIAATCPVVKMIKEETRIVSNIV